MVRYPDLVPRAVVETNEGALSYGEQVRVHVVVSALVAGTASTSSLVRGF